jgi:acetyl esterase/lipase
MRKQCREYQNAETDASHHASLESVRSGDHYRRAIAAASNFAYTAHMRPAALVTLCFAAMLGLAAPATDLVKYRVAPHDTDPAITRFDDPHYIVFDRSAPATADLVVFMSGTGGKPANVSDFLDLAAGQGYRVISLAYNDTPAVVAVCPPDPDANCSAKVRQKRIFGDNVTGRVDDTPAESIVNRLVKLLVALDLQHPSEGWGAYLDNGAPRWNRIVITGHSQGAGMAAYIAQRRTVARVVLFSSPWDFHGRLGQLAPWVLDGPGKTPAASWFAAYHKSENTARYIAEAYRALKVPAANTRVFDLEPARKTGENPYHLSMVGNLATPRDPSGAPAYADNWTFLIGTSR